LHNSPPFLTKINVCMWLTPMHSSVQNTHMAANIHTANQRLIQHVCNCSTQSTSKTMALCVLMMQ
jgi:hypothetical protein